MRMRKILRFKHPDLRMMRRAWLMIPVSLTIPADTEDDPDIGTLIRDFRRVNKTGQSLPIETIRRARTLLKKHKVFADHGAKEKQPTQ